MTPGATIAPVGQDGMHTVHRPHPRRDGASTGSATDTAMDARSTYEPAASVITEACFPANPTPARSAMARSRAHPWSTKTLGSETLDPLAEPLHQRVAPLREEVVVIDGTAAVLVQT